MSMQTTSLSRIRSFNSRGSSKRSILILTRKRLWFMHRISIWCNSLRPKLTVLMKSIRRLPKGIMSLWLHKWKTEGDHFNKLMSIRDSPRKTRGMDSWSCRRWIWSNSLKIHRRLKKIGGLMEGCWGYPQGPPVVWAGRNRMLFKVSTPRFHKRGVSTQGSLIHSPTSTTNKHTMFSQWQNGLIFKRLQLDT